MQDSVLIFLHGGPGMSPACFDEVTQALEGKIEVKSVHSGKSGDYSIRGLVEEVDAVVSGCAQKNVFLLGHSFGGALALEYIKQKNPKLAGLCLVSWVYDKDFLAAFMANNADYQEPQIPEGLSPDEQMKQTVIADVELYFSRNAKDKGVRALQAMEYNKALSNEVYPNYLMSFDLKDQLKLLNMPVLSISGGADRVVAYDYLQAGEAEISGCITRCYEASGHFPFVENSERFVEDLLGFIQ